MRILLTGVTGQVGWELQRTLMTLGEIIAVERSASHPSLQIDLAQPETIRRLIRDIKPDLIINPAAYTAVDKAESEPDLAMAINGIAPGIIAEEAKRIGAVVIHYSTDYVFDGNKTTAYTEQDRPNPQNIYGKTKLVGEQAIASVGVPHLILRTSWVYSRRGKNFLLTMLRLAQEREEIRVVEDQIGAPTWSRMIAEATSQIISQGSQNISEFLAAKGGIYHLTASGKTSWYGFAKAIFELEDKKSDRKLQRLIPIPSQEYPTPATRPAYSLLDSQKLSDNFGLVLPDWQRSLELVMVKNNS
ncbi:MULTISPECIES: dTDP-4-dehydrorhamnose reductase [unclassified Tolypothrix]|uniref:dTDP-4-dehydrorhamnose reductase n=1 Tax=unclassified Tolypothrix TaxID=2649714 RepID=UPI0005EAA42D|nr:MULTISPECIES: dTDP-4-dehydrorhamnose reductase [unclassified Tolypothrix]BAY92956.1 dTDP-6-deoxy-L-mannose-dehydrogenase [Microchaete diplosiphon NIES-3275]EKF03065.1 dTDP-4-dehydrorhamnose reductase [Tolypothrix sp. PCC 7601]MBE9083106.1 dTDP-4-dehydrorhamnose reductase [Tolypothrix sp. LEGE 11397]UYD26852.1 dTDP-4-dehydrorhamnose reductase [Tolypothrix sp. PCC 7712]UYD37290.1 dTDP-4-dehydrorhamnose reductase [Tolypothrix sp. PCC 7601]